MKIRTSFVSNSSSSSFVIACKGQKLAEFVQKAYGKLFDLWMELNPSDTGYGLDRDNYHIASVDEIIEHFRGFYMNKEDLRYNKESFEEEAKKGYVYLLGSCSDDDGTPEWKIVEMFNDYLLSALKGRYDPEKGFKNDVELVFQTRWS